MWCASIGCIISTQQQQQQQQQTLETLKNSKTLFFAHAWLIATVGTCTYVRYGNWMNLTYVHCVLTTINKRKQQTIFWLALKNGINIFFKSDLGIGLTDDTNTAPAVFFWQKKLRK